MEITLYKTNSEKNDLNKVLTASKNISGGLVNETNIVNPSIDVALDTDYFTYNYAYIPAFSRYYYITDIKISDKCITLLLHCDPLMSFKSDILNSVCHVIRSKKGSKWIKDPMVATTNKVNWQARKIGVGFVNHDSYILQVGGIQ